MKAYGLRRIVLALVLGMALYTLLVSQVHAADGDTTADRVFGQADFTSNSSGLSASALTRPGGIAVDAASGRLYVADNGNHRVLSWPNAAAQVNGQPADLVLGQAGFTSGACNRGDTPAANTLCGPAGLAVDTAGNLYVADQNNHRVLLYLAPISSGMNADVVLGQDGDFTTNIKNKGGLSASSLARPAGVAVGIGHYLIVADHENHRVLFFNRPALRGAIDAERVIGQSGFSAAKCNRDAATPSANTLCFPTGVALSSYSDALYIADSNNHRVLRYDYDDAEAVLVLGQMGYTTGACNQGVLSPSAGSLCYPAGIAMDAAGSLYVADAGNHRVLEYDMLPPMPDRFAERVFGQGDSFTTKTANKGGVSADSLHTPPGVAVDGASNLYVSDGFNHRVLEFDLPAPHEQPVITSPGPDATPRGSLAFSLTVNGNHFVTSSVVRWNGSERPTTYISPNRLVARIPAEDVSSGPGAVTVHTEGAGESGAANLDLYVTAAEETVADRVFGQPNLATNKGSETLGEAHCHDLSAADVDPEGVAIDPVSGRLFVADTTSHRVLSWANAAAQANGQPADLVLGQANFLQRAPNRRQDEATANGLYYPRGLALDADGNLFVADSRNHRVVVFAPPFHNGMDAFAVLGQSGLTGLADCNRGGDASAATLCEPYDVAADGEDDVYVADYDNDRVLGYRRPLETDTTADLVFGQHGDFTSHVRDFGGVSPSSLDSPYGVDVDGVGNVYVSDYGNNRVLAFSQPWETDTVADLVFGQQGDFTTEEDNKGGVSADSLNSPYDVVLDGADNLYVADLSNNRVLQYDRPLATDTTADRVFGQGDDFTRSDPNNGGVSAISLSQPIDMAVDAQGNLYVADEGNERLLVYERPLPRISQTINFAALADRTWGDPPFTLSAEASSDLQVTFRSDTPGVCTVSSNTVTLTGAGTCTVVASQAGNGYYLPAEQSQSFRVVDSTHPLYLPLLNSR